MSICVSADGLSVSVYHSSHERPIQHSEQPLRQGDEAHAVLESMLRQMRLVGKRPAEVTLVADTPATMLPLEEFRSSDVPTLYRLNFPHLQLRPTEVRYEILPDTESVVLFWLDEQLFDTVMRLYPDARLRHRQSLLLDDALEKARRSLGSARQFFAYAGPSQLFLCLFNKDKLRFACAYEATNDADRLYYLLAAWKSLGLDPEKDACHLQGASDELARKVGNYLLEIRD